MALCEHKKTQRMIIASIALGLGLGQELISADTTIMDFIAGTVRNALVKKTTSWRHRKRVRNVASAAVKQNSGPAAHVGCVLSVHSDCVVLIRFIYCVDSFRALCYFMYSMLLLLLLLLLPSLLLAI